LVYLMPGGQAREAVGSYNVVRTRAAKRIWSNRVNRHRVYRLYTSIPSLQARVNSYVRNSTQISSQIGNLQAQMFELQGTINNNLINDSQGQYKVVKEQFNSAMGTLADLLAKQTAMVKKMLQ